MHRHFSLCARGSRLAERGLRGFAAGELTSPSPSPAGSGGKSSRRGGSGSGSGRRSPENSMACGGPAAQFLDNAPTDCAGRQCRSSAEHTRANAPLPSAPTHALRQDGIGWVMRCEPRQWRHGNSWTSGVRLRQLSGSWARTSRAHLPPTADGSEWRPDLRGWRWGKQCIPRVSAILARGAGPIGGSPANEVALHQGGEISGQFPPRAVAGGEELPVAISRELSD
jgi:hypothetical protein